MTPMSHDNRFDFLRLLAAWLVLFSHSFPLSGAPQLEPLASSLGIDTLGGVGVSIFFVLSGYLVTLSFERSPRPWPFLRKRIVRIYPALAVTCLLSVLVLGPLLTALPLRDYGAQPATWSYLKNITAIKIQYALPGVFDQNPLPHAVNGSLWSLPYEIKCYAALLVLGLLPLSLRVKSVVAVCMLAGIALARPESAFSTPFQKFVGLDLFDCKLGLSFALGCAFAAWKSAVKPSWIWGAGLATLAALLPVGKVALLLWISGVCVLALWLALEGRWLPVVPQRMGDWSYGAYLYGFPIQQWLAQAGVQHWGLVWFIIGSTVVTLALAGASWHLVEKPAMRWKQGFIR